MRAWCLRRCFTWELLAAVSARVIDILWMLNMPGARDAAFDIIGVMMQREGRHAALFEIYRLFYHDIDVIFRRHTILAHARGR